MQIELNTGIKVLYLFEQYAAGLSSDSYDKTHYIPITHSGSNGSYLIFNFLKSVTVFPAFHRQKSIKKRKVERNQKARQGGSQHCQPKGTVTQPKWKQTMLKLPAVFYYQESEQDYQRT